MAGAPYSEDVEDGEQHFQPYSDDPGSDDEDGLLPDSIGRVGMEDPAAPGRPSRIQTRIRQSLPPRLVKSWDFTVKWVKGPQPPRIYIISPVFPALQHAPLILLDRYLPKRLQRSLLLLAFCLSWLVAFSVIQWQSNLAGEIPGHGSPQRLWCGSSLWSGGNGCGINGDQCRPFGNDTMAFRCPANCESIILNNPYTVGDKDVIYQNLVVGSSLYRADSFICPAAVHSGFINDLEGGCGVLELIGEQHSFDGTDAHHISSIGFDSYFPRSFRFRPGSRRECKDLRWSVLAASAVATALLGIFTTSPAVFFWSSFTILFATTSLATDPPNQTDYHSLLSTAIGRFLPGCFCMAIMYRYAIRRSLTDLTAQIEKTVLWLGPAWIGALNNYTFEYIPIQRLTTHDLKSQPGAVPALIIIVLSIFAIALGQAWCFRIEGRMPRYLALYGGMGATLLLFIAVPGLNLRIHHYILALLFLPGTCFQTRPSLVYQGLLVGLFVNGVARWGFAPLLETPGALFAGDNLGTLLPNVSAPVVGARADNVTFALGPLPQYAGDGTRYDGVSVLVNDVERLRTYADYRDGGWVDGAREWTWNRHVEGLPEYFRFAYMVQGSPGDYTKAGKWLADGTWVEMKPGPS